MVDGGAGSRMDEEGVGVEHRWDLWMKQRQGESEGLREIR